MTEAELQELARDRHQRTPELHPGNDYYGHAATLKRYSGLPQDRPLHAVVEHGAVLGTRIWKLDLRAPFPTFLCAGEMRAQLYRKHRPEAHAIPIGPLIRYVDDRPPARRPAGNLLAFPAHSTHFVRAVYDAEKFARKLASYRDRFAKITVCIYWRDVLDGAAGPYLAEGFDCVTAGHIFDLGFLARLRTFLEEAHTVISNHFGSYVPYAVALGRPVWLLDQEVRYVGPPRALARDALETDQYLTLARDIRRAFSEEVDEVTPEQREILNPIAGFDRIRSPAELRAILAQAEERYFNATSSPRRAFDHFIGRVVRPLAARVLLR